MDSLDLTESMQIEWLHMLDDYWDEEDNTTRIIMLSVLIGCINISMNFR